ncbi:MAG: ECF-type sigma factor [Acidobacteriota bacterium]
MTSTAVTEWIRAHRSGDPDAFDRLVELVYDDLRRIARQQRRGRSATLETSALVHEAYLRLSRADPAWNDRRHFYAVAARAMRQIFVDHARRHRRAKRGGDVDKVPFDEAMDAPVSAPVERALAIDEALRRLEASEPRLVRVVECRFFAGLSEEETRDVLEVSLRTVQRDWQRAREVLRSILSDGDVGDRG